MLTVIEKYVKYETLCNIIIMDTNTCIDRYVKETVCPGIPEY